MYLQTNAYMYVHVYVHVCMYAHHVHVCVCVYVCMLSGGLSLESRWESETASEKDRIREQTWSHPESNSEGERGQEIYRCKVTRIRAHTHTHTHTHTHLYLYLSKYLYLYLYLYVSVYVGIYK